MNRFTLSLSILCLSLLILFSCERNEESPKKDFAMFPADNSINADTGSQLSLTFEEAVTLQNGTISIYDYQGNLFESISAISGNVSGSGTDKINILIEKNFQDNTSYYVQLEPQILGNDYLSVTNNTVWNFSTGPILEEIMRSVNVNHDLKLYISYPAGYDSEQDQKLPVIYYTDGYWNIEEHAKVHAAAENGEISEAIVVGIGYANEDSILSYRDRDLTIHPERFYDFFRKELISYIDNNYQTDPGNRTLAGASYGAYFTLYALFQYNENEALFKSFMAASPSLWRNEFYLLNLEPQFAQRTKNLPVNLYMTVGALETENDSLMIKNFEMMKNQLIEHQYTDFRFEHDIIEGADHYNTANPTYRKGLSLFLQ